MESLQRMCSSEKSQERYGFASTVANVDMEY